MGLSAAQPKPTTAPQYRGSLCSWGGLCGSPLPFPGAFSPGTAMETEAPPRAPLTGTAACPLPPALLTPCLGTMPDLPLHLALSPTGQLSSIPEPKPRSRPLPGIRTHGCPAPAPAVAPAHVSSVLSGLPRAARASSPPSLPCPPPGPPLSQLRLPCPTTRPWPVLTMLHACPSLSWEEQPQLCSQLAWNSSVPGADASEPWTLRSPTRSHTEPTPSRAGVPAQTGISTSSWVTLSAQPRWAADMPGQGGSRKSMPSSQDSRDMGLPGAGAQGSSTGLCCQDLGEQARPARPPGDATVPL